MADLRKDLAVALGVSAATVTRDAAAGMPTHSVDAAREWRAANRRARVSPPPRSGHAAVPEGATAAGPPRIPSTAAGVDASGATSDDYWTSRARREAAEAKIAERKLAELDGILIRADDVRAALARKAAAFREGIMQIPSRLAAVLAAETSQAKVHDLLEAELRATLLVLTD